MILTLSCTELLEEDLYTNPSLSGLSTLEDAKYSLTGAYAGLLGNSNAGYYGRNYLYLREIPTDNLLGTGQERSLDDFSFDDNQITLRNTYSDIYNMILRANILLDNIDAADISLELKNQFKAEAQYLVALGYYDLSSLFGPVALITSSVNDITNKPERATLASIENFIFTILETAIPNLSETKLEDRPGAVTLGAAYALKMKLHLRRKEWGKVVEYADLIVNLGQYSLLPKVEDLYVIGNSDNSEIIFSVKTTGVPFGKSLNALAAGSTDIAIHNYDWQNDYYGFGTFRGELKVYYSYDPDDERFKKLFRHQFFTRSGQSVAPLQEDGTKKPEINKGQPFVYSNKYPHPLAGTQSDFRTDIYHANTLFVSRYAEILLAKAEALNELNGPSDDVYNLINEVRNRSNLPNIQTTGNFDQNTLRSAIFQERQWEFFMEGYRREDLIRQGTFVEKITNSHFKVNDIIDVQECNQLYPIPGIEKSLNKNLIIPNNCY